MNKYFILKGVILSLCLCQLTSLHAQTSEELINMMADATKNLNYEGTFIFSRGDDIDVMRILHRLDDDGEREKIIALTGPAREIIRNNDTVTCIFPDKQEVMVERSRAQGFPSKLPEAIEVLSEFYEFSTIGDERMAGKDAWVVQILPKDEFRYGYQLWIDKDNHLLLKSEMQNDMGKTLELVMFTELELRESIIDEMFEPSVSGHEYTWYQYIQEEYVSDNSSGNSLSNGWQVTWMPAGFKLNEYDGNSKSMNNSTLEHMIYSDGISTVSIFIESLNDQLPINTGSMNIGGVNVYSRSTNGFQVTAVGEVPQPTVMRMVDSVVATR
jgi:sigma-E factor negative regulatory protein RseB